MGTVHAIGPNKPSIENVVATLEMAKEYAVSGGAVKCLIILLNDTNGQYLHRRLNAGMVSTEMVALVELEKHEIIRGMG